MKIYKSFQDSYEQRKSFYKNSRSEENKNINF